jgi:hypothetical protein
MLGYLSRRFPDTIVFAALNMIRFPSKVRLDSMGRGRKCGRQRFDTTRRTGAGLWDDENGDDEGLAWRNG